MNKAKVLGMVLLLAVLPNFVFASISSEVVENEVMVNEQYEIGSKEIESNETEPLNEVDQMLKEYEEMMPTILPEQADTFIYTILAVMAVSMVFENILKYQKDKIREIKDEVGITDDPELIRMEKEATVKRRRIMWIVLGVYFGCLIIFYFISKLVLKFENQITGALLFVSFVTVILSTFVKIRIFRRRKK